MSNHTSEALLSEKLDECRKIVLVNKFYYHYRSPSDYYKVLDLGLDEATEKVVVIYQAQFGKNLIWTRDIDIWCESVEHNGRMISRFNIVK